MRAEVAAHPTEERIGGAGWLIAQSIVGPRHGLHSRAGAILALALQEDLLELSDLKVHKVSAAGLQDQKCGPSLLCRMVRVPSKVLVDFAIDLRTYISKVSPLCKTCGILILYQVSLAPCTKQSAER